MNTPNFQSYSSLKKLSAFSLFRRCLREGCTEHCFRVNGKAASFYASLIWCLIGQWPCNATSEAQKHSLTAWCLSLDRGVKPIAVWGETPSAVSFRKKIMHRMESSASNSPQSALLIKTMFSTHVVLDWCSTNRELLRCDKLFLWILKSSSSSHKDSMRSQQWMRTYCWSLPWQLFFLVTSRSLTSHG